MHRAQHSIEGPSLNIRCGSKPLSNALGRSTEIACATTVSAVRPIAKMTNQRHHTALIVLREADHLIDLCPLLLSLGDVGRSPCPLTLAHILREVHDRTFMNPKFLDDFVEEFFLDGQGSAEPFFWFGFCTKICKYSIHQRNIWIIPTEKEIVGMPVSVGMHEDGATRISVAPSAANLLVIPFKTARKRGVNHGSHIRLIDTHAECDGCYHDIQLSCHESFLNTSPPLGVQPTMVAGHAELASPFFRQILGLLRSEERRVGKE